MSEENIYQELTPIQLRALLAFLEDRKRDIVSEWEDFGRLQPLLALLDWEKNH